MPSPSAAAQLAALLAKSSRRLSQETLRVARALGPGAADVVTEILDRQRDPATRTNGRTAGRAALLAQELRLAGAIPALVRCVEHLDTIDPLADSALGALQAFGADAAPALLDAMERRPTPDARQRLASALVQTGVKGDRVLQALVSGIDVCAVCAADDLQTYGDARAVPALSRALDRAEPGADDGAGPAADEDVVALGAAILSLGGMLSSSQADKLDTALRHLGEKPLFDERQPTEVLH
jgi:hypothetical protein